jgi:hypothetical protein
VPLSNVKKTGNDTAAFVVLVKYSAVYHPPPNATGGSSRENDSGCHIPDTIEPSDVVDTTRTSPLPVMASEESPVYPHPLSTAVPEQSLDTEYVPLPLALRVGLRATWKARPPWPSNTT